MNVNWYKLSLLFRIHEYKIKFFTDIKCVYLHSIRLVSSKTSLRSCRMSRISREKKWFFIPLIQYVFVQNLSNLIRYCVWHYNIMYNIWFHVYNLPCLHGLWVRLSKQWQPLRVPWTLWDRLSKVRLRIPVPETRISYILMAYSSVFIICTVHE